MKAVLITGASSGLGAALALEYARPGTTLFLSGRAAPRLEQVAGQCRAKGAATETAILDVADAQAMADWIDSCDAKAPLDLVIANAGISLGSGGTLREDADSTREIFATNITGVANTVWPAVVHMRRRKRGQIAIMSSLASFRGFDGAAAYCASKAAVRVWGEGLRQELRRHGITVSVICPGFVKTPMTDVNTFRMPLLMEPADAARLMVRALAKGKGRIAYPRRLYAAAWATGALPDAVMDWISRWLPTKTGR